MKKILQYYYIFHLLALVAIHFNINRPRTFVLAGVDLCKLYIYSQT